MATLSPPSCKPSPITVLPTMTTVTFNVAPRGSKVQIEYELRSPELQFQSAGQGAELPMSLPTPIPASRGQSRIVDVLDNLNGRTLVTRALAIEQAGAAKPGIATLFVTASDFSTGVAEFTSSDSATMAFTLT